jgi:hypothetical protein
MSSLSSQTEKGMKTGVVGVRVLLEAGVGNEVKAAVEERLKCIIG